MSKYLISLSLLLLAAVSGCKKDHSSTSPSNWQYASTSITGQVYDISFLNKDTGYILALSNSIQTTAMSVDQGLHWQTFRDLPVPAFPAFQVFYPLTAQFIIAARDTLWYSQDGGNTWLKGSDPDQTFVGSLRCFSFPTSRTGFALGTNTVYKTGDALHWSLSRTMPTLGYDYLLFLDSLHGFAAGGNMVERNATTIVTSFGLLSSTQDGGKTWVELEKGSFLNNTQSFHKIVGISFLTPTIGYIATDDEKLLYTTDGGNTFSAVNGKMGLVPQDMYFESESTGYLITGALVYKTTDGGKTLSKDFTARAHLIKIYHKDGLPVFIIGANGIVLRKT